ncbi:galactokinase [Streptomyces sp. NBC_01142]|uniref:galactokinase n=1 Tax=Streptomyces sp. NBC_01142 TaxID=2975865 RepID=UPI002257380B|nr:galactokinase [Streptomyces sp. NBC_01142]MCX4825272.1 galactokinase [Streptomyces sp. NBC_01142]
MQTNIQTDRVRDRTTDRTTDRVRDGQALDIARRPTADPLFRLVAYALESAHDRHPATVWSAPHAFHLGSPRLVAAAGWPVAAAAAPRDDGLVRLSSLAHPAQSCELPLTGPPPPHPDWAARTYALLRTMARAGYGRGGIDLHIHSTLTTAVGLSSAEPLECAVALAVADLHSGGARPRPPRGRLAALAEAAAPDGDEALRSAVLFARPGRALLLGDSRPRRIRFDPAEHGARLMLLVTRGGTEDTGRAVDSARRAGATASWWPGLQPGRSALVLLPQARLTDVRTAVAEEFRSRGRPVPRLLNITVAGAARHED